MNGYIPNIYHRNHRLSAVRLYLTLSSAKACKAKCYNVTSTTPNVKPAINTLLFIQHLIQKMKTLQYCMQVCFGNCDWFEMAHMIYNFVSEKSKKYFSGSTILQRTTKKPLYLTMTACAVCSSVGNSFHTYFGSYVFLWPVPGINIICSKAFV